MSKNWFKDLKDLKVVQGTNVHCPKNLAANSEDNYSISEIAKDIKAKYRDSKKIIRI
jgi:hypothetical protein